MLGQSVQRHRETSFHLTVERLGVGGLASFKNHNVLSTGMGGTASESASPFVPTKSEAATYSCRAAGHTK
jgi:hypothetical protein